MWSSYAWETGLHGFADDLKASPDRWHVDGLRAWWQGKLAMRKLFGAVSILLLASCLSFSQNNNDQSSTTTSQGRAQTTTRPTDVTPRNRNDNWGWIGIIGLAGLAGLAGRRDRGLTTRDYDRERRPDDIRRAA